MHRQLNVSWRTLLIVALLGSLAAGCRGCPDTVETSEFFTPASFGEYEFDGEPDIEAPDRVLFVDVPIGTSDVQTFGIRNIGRETLKVSEWRISDGFELSFVDRMDTPLEIRPRTAVMVAVKFTAPDDEEHRGTLTISSNDPDEPTVEIALFANAKLPCLETVPDDVVDFGEIDPDESLTRIVRIRNCSPNTPTEFSMLGIQGNPAFSFANDPGFTDAVLAVGESLEVRVQFAPTEAGLHEATLDFVSNDEFRPEHSLELRGVGKQGRCPTPVIVAAHPERGEAIASPDGTLEALPLDRIRLSAEGAATGRGRRCSSMWATGPRAVTGFA